MLKRWRRELKLAALTPPDFDGELAPLIDELGRIIAGGSGRDEAALVFAEALAGRGARRYQQGARLRDAEREVALFEVALVRVWAAEHGDLPPDVALMLNAVVGEAVVRVARDYARTAEELRQKRSSACRRCCRRWPSCRRW